jgi:hypothetical protein
VWGFEKMNIYLISKEKILKYEECERFLHLEILFTLFKRRILKEENTNAFHIGILFPLFQRGLGGFK